VSTAGALLLAADATTRLYFRPNTNFNGDIDHAITFRAWDGTSGGAGSIVSTMVNGGSTAFSTATDTASLTVDAVNDNPVATNDVLWVSNSTTVTLSLSTLLGNDSDIDGLALSLAFPSPSAAPGQFTSNPTLNGNGTFSFTTNSTGGTVDDPIQRTFTYTLSDGAGGTATGTVTVNVVTLAPGNTAEEIDLSDVAMYQGAYIDARGGADDVSSADWHSVLVGGAQGDTLNGGDGNDILRGGAQNDILNGGNGIDLLDFSDATSGFTLTFASGSGSVNNSVTGLGNDDYTGMEGVIGSSTGNDTLNGSSSADVLWGLGGTDTLNGNGGNDTLRGGAGNDTIDGGLDIDLLDFSDATGAIGTLATAFTLSQGTNGGGNWSTGALSGLGTDAYRNVEGMTGSSFNDFLAGSSSGDVIIGGAGADRLTGNGGSDRFTYRNGDASAVDTITDFDVSAAGLGGDVLDIRDLLGGASVTGGNVSNYLDIRESDGDTILSIDRDGAGSTYGFQDFVVLSDRSGLSLTSLLANGNIDTGP